MTTPEAMRRALAALKAAAQHDISECADAIAALESALAAPVQEPVADCGEYGHAQGCCGNAQCIARRAVPVQPAAPQPLTDEQIGLLSTTRTFTGMHPDYLRDCVRAIEAAHGITHKAQEDADGVKPTARQQENGGHHA